MRYNTGMELAILFLVTALGALGAALAYLAALTIHAAPGD
jgi:hypothetical protein